MESGRLLEELIAIEDCAEDIIADKRHITELDKKRHKLCEAISALKKRENAPKTWTCFNNVFIKIESSSTISLLEKDYHQLEEEIHNIRSSLKSKVNTLRDLKQESSLKGFDLSPLTSEDRSFIDMAP